MLGLVRPSRLGLVCWASSCRRDGAMGLSVGGGTAGGWLGELRRHAANDFGSIRCCRRRARGNCVHLPCQEANVILHHVQPCRAMMPTPVQPCRAPVMSSPLAVVGSQAMQSDWTRPSPPQSCRLDACPPWTSHARGQETSHARGRTESDAQSSNRPAVITSGGCGCKTSFLTQLGRFECNVVLFGLQGSVSLLMRVMHEALTVGLGPSTASLPPDWAPRLPHFLRIGPLGLGPLDCRPRGHAGGARPSRQVRLGLY